MATETSPLPPPLVDVPITSRHEKKQEWTAEKLRLEITTMKRELEELKWENDALHLERQELQEHIRKLFRAQLEKIHSRTQNKRESSWYKKRECDQAKTIADLQAANSKIEKHNHMQQLLINSMEKKLLRMVEDRGPVHHRPTEENKTSNGKLTTPASAQSAGPRPMDKPCQMTMQSDYLQAVMDKQKLTRENNKQQKILYKDNIKKRFSSVGGGKKIISSLRNLRTYLTAKPFDDDATTALSSTKSEEVFDEISVDYTVKLSDGGVTEIFVNDYSTPNSGHNDGFVGELSSFLESDDVPEAIESFF